MYNSDITFNIVDVPDFGSFNSEGITNDVERFRRSIAHLSEPRHFIIVQRYRELTSFNFIFHHMRDVIGRPDILLTHCVDSEHTETFAQTYRAADVYSVNFNNRQSQQDQSLMQLRNEMLDKIAAKYSDV